MYATLLYSHSLVRWLVVGSLIVSILIATRGVYFNLAFTAWTNRIRHWTATIAHIQLILGVILYTKSPIVHYFWTDLKTAIQQFEITFFGLLHSLLMFLSIILITIGSALAKRQETDGEKYRVMRNWFVFAFIILCLAIPWPFSPLVTRPYYR